MAFVIKDRVKETTTTTGTGAVALGGAAATFDTFQSVLTNGDTTYYAIVHTTSGVDEWEVGLGTWNTGNTLTRTTVISGSNGTSAQNFQAGTKSIFITMPSSRTTLLDASGDLETAVTLGNHNTGGLAEGSNLYYTDARVNSHLSGGTGVTYNDGAISIGQAVATNSTPTFGSITLAADPTTGLQVATKQYVDSIAAAGVHYHDPVRVSIATNFPSTYDNGSSGVGATLTNSGTQAAIVIDGVSLVLNDRVLIKGQTNARHNGVYKVTTVGSGSANWVLTRTTDTDSYGASDKDALGEGDAFFVSAGAVNGGALDVMNVAGVITFGTTEITFVHMLDTTIYSAGTGLTLTGTVFAAAQDITTSGNPQFGTVTANLTGNVTGNVTGNTSGSSGSTTGNAATATALATARTIALSGDVTGSASFDGSGNISITSSVQDDSHAHVVSNVDGLQAALDAKVPTARTISVGGGLTGGGDLTANRTITHADTSSQASVDNSGTTFIQDVTIDTYGHVTGLASASLSVGAGGLTQENFTTTLKNKLDAIEASATADQTAAQLLTAIKTVDGAGSGLDADLLDGVSSASFLRSDADDTFTTLRGAEQYIYGTSRWQVSTSDVALQRADARDDATNYSRLHWYGESAPSGGTSNFRHAWYDGSAYINVTATSGTLNFAGSLSELQAGGNKVWHAGNDGAGSGLDADLLDGNQASAFATSAQGTLATNALPKAGGAMTGSTTISGNNHMTFGPNATWSSTIRIGGNGYTASGTEMASVVTTDGNLHLDAANSSSNGIYHGWYGGTLGHIFGNGSAGQIAKIDNSGNFTLSGTVDGVDISARDAVLTTTTNTANAALPKAGGNVTGPININGGTAQGSNDATLSISASNSNDWGISINANSGKTEYGQVIYMPATFNYAFRVMKAGVEHLVVNTAGLTVVGSITATSFTATSDINLKTNIKPISNSMSKLKEITGVEFDWKETGEASAGVIAQDVEKVLPQAVQENGEGVKSVNYNAIIGLLIETVKDQQKQIDRLENRIN